MEFAMLSIVQKPRVLSQNPSLHSTIDGIHKHYRTVSLKGHQLSASDILLWLLQLPPDSPHRRYLQTTGVLMGRLSWRSSKQVADRPKGTKSLARSLFISIHLPILRRTFTLKSQRAMGMWTHTFRITRIVPDNSPIFRLCATGDEPAIRGLFNEGLASPFDQTSWGVKLLHVSLETLAMSFC
jgi:hypothetical protein